MPLSVSPVATIGTSPVGPGVEAIVVVVGAAVVVVVVVVVITSSHLSPVQPVHKNNNNLKQNYEFASALLTGENVPQPDFMTGMPCPCN